MVKIVIPHRVKSPSADFRCANDPSIVSIALRDQMDVPAERLGPGMNGCAKFFEEGSRGIIHNRVDGVEAKGIDGEGRYPFQRILDEISGDLVALCVIEIDRLSPRRLVKIREIRTEISQVITLWTKMVVDHIEHHRDFQFMASVNQPFQPQRTSIRRLDRIGVNSVISPVALSGKLSYGHQFDCRNAQIFERRKARDNGVEGSLRRECPHMKLVENVLFKWQPSPSGVVPAKPTIYDLRWPVHASGLISGRRIGPFLFIVQAIAIESPRGNALSDNVKIPAADSLHRNRARWGFADTDVNPVRVRSPDEKTACILT